MPWVLPGVGESVGLAAGFDEGVAEGKSVDHVRGGKVLIVRR